MASPRWRRLVYALVPLAALVGGGEALLWALGLPGPSRPFEHDEVYWITPPGLERAPWQHRETGRTFAVSTDENGLRWPLHATARPPGAQRVLLLGCSTTFGWGVDDTDTWPAVLERRLHDAGRTDVEVLNGGQPGYTSFQGLWFYRTVARAYDPDVVVFGYVVQDARLAAWTDASQAMLQRDRRWLEDHLLHRSRLYVGLRTVVDRARSGAAGGEGGVFRVPLEEYAAHIRAFASLAREDGFRLVLFGFPLERSGYTAEHREVLRAVAVDLGLDELDMQAEMEDLSRTRTLYFPEDRGHPNADGYRVVAERMDDFLRSGGLLGETAR